MTVEAFVGGTVDGVIVLVAWAGIYLRILVRSLFCPSIVRATVNFDNLACGRPDPAFVEESLLRIGFSNPVPGSSRQYIQEAIGKAHNRTRHKSDVPPLTFFANQCSPIIEMVVKKVALLEAALLDVMTDDR